MAYKNHYGHEGERSPRALARHVALSALAIGYRLSNRWAALARNRVQFLYLHHLFPEEEQSFRQLLERLSQDHYLISYTEAVARVESGQIDRPYVCFSFDDGLQNNLRAGQILSEFGSAACFFICPALVEEADQRVLEDYCVRRIDLPLTKLLGWREIEQLLELGHEIGSHTMSHKVQADLSGRQSEDEINASYQLLSARLGGVRHFAWPRGRFHHFNAAAAAAVFRAGYQSCASAERGCHVVGLQQPRHGLCIRRDYISAHWPQNHTLYFMARSSLRARAENNQWPTGWFEAIAEQTGRHYEANGHPC